jgi:amino-acid N-acetyltransferase
LAEVAAGLERFMLLTETAADFFHRHGYRVVQRIDAPAALRASSQFASVCPASAIYMEKRLAERLSESSRAARTRSESE